MSSEHVVSTAQTDLGLRSRTFFSENKLPTFCDITQVKIYMAR